MNYKRADRVASVIQNVVSSQLLREVQDPAVQFVTITKVKVTDDIRHAKIYFSVLKDDQLEKAQDALERSKGMLRSAVGKQMKLRHVPTLAFYYDDSTAYAHHIETLLQQIRTEK